MSGPYAGPRASQFRPDTDMIQAMLDFWFGDLNSDGEVEIGWVHPATGKLNQFK